MVAEVQRPAMLGQGAAVDQFGAGFSERAFVEAREFFVKLASQDELQDRIAEEFQSLIMLDGRSLFMRHRRMRESQTQLIFVAKMITEAGLEGGKVGHGGKRVLNDDLRFTIAVPSAVMLAIHKS